MEYNPDIHHRRSIRLEGYDYSQAGLYFITICTQNHLCLFGEIEKGEMILNDAGRMVERQWIALHHRFDGAKMHEYCVMPNHFHGIIELAGVPLVGSPNAGTVPPTVGISTVPPVPYVGAPLVGARNEEKIPNTEHPPTEQSQFPPTEGQPQGIAPTIGDIAGAFKSITTNEYIRGVKNNNWPRYNKILWQRNFYEHIIRNEKSCCQISEYIQINPLNWQDDEYYK